MNENSRFNRLFILCKSTKLFCLWRFLYRKKRGFRVLILQTAKQSNQKRNCKIYDYALINRDNSIVFT